MIGLLWYKNGDILNPLILPARMGACGRRFRNILASDGIYCRHVCICNVVLVDEK